MSRLSSVLVLLFAAVCSFAQIRVVSDRVIGNGFYPHISEDGSQIYFVADEGTSFKQATSAVYTTNESCHLYLHNGTTVTTLTPDGADAHYIWSSISPDGTKIVYNTARGTSICTLAGERIAYLGHLNAPVWYGNDHVVGMHDLSDGHMFTGSSIAIRDIETGVETALTDDSSFAMYPSVSASTGRIAYNTLDGEMHLMQINLADQPVSAALPALSLAPTTMSRPKKTVRTHWDSLSDVKIYINPGHGGHASNDRNIIIYPYQSGDVNGFWESNSNLDKGLQLNAWLQALGVQTMMSRTTNNDGGGNDSDILKRWLQYGTITQAEYDDMLQNGDDRSLSAIVAEANAYDADFMISIHSNAGGPANYVLELYAGKDADDTHSYPTATPVSNESRAISTIIGNNLIKNRLTTWSSITPNIAGDKTFARECMGWSNGYGVLRGLTVPGVISEGCMHDYNPETYRLMNMDYKWKESFYFMQSFLTYFLNYTYPTGAIGGQVRDAYNKQTFPDITRRKGTRDELNPLCGAHVTLYQNGDSIKDYTTDNLYNGIFFFWDLTPGQYVVRAQYDGYYDYLDTIQVSAGDISYSQCMMNLRRTTRPEVTSYSPQVNLTDSVEVKTPIIINFSWDMLEDSTAAAFHLSPACEGTLTFENSQKTLRFTPTNGFEKGTEYTVTLDTTACHPDFAYLNHLAQPLAFTFRTKDRSHLNVMQVYPPQGETGLSLRPTVFVLFDAEINGAASTLAPYFTLTAEGDSYTPGIRAFKKNTVPSPYGNARFEVTKDLLPNTTYTLSIDPSLKDVNDVTLGSTYTTTFTTGDGTEVKHGVVINSFEEQAFSVDYDKSAGILDKTMGLDKNRVTEGTYSNHIVYSFDEDVDQPHMFMQPYDLTHEFTSLDTLCMDVYGDMSGNTLTLVFSTEGDIHYIELCSMDFVGWKSFEIPCSSLPESVTFQWTGLRLDKGDGVLSASGEFYLDRLARIEGQLPAALEDVENTASSNKRVSGGTLYIFRDNAVYGADGKKLR